MRVVSLVPSVTETLLAWGIEPVAVTRFCEQPGYRDVGGTKNPDVDAIVALAPDLVVMDEEENRREDALALARAGLRVHATAVRSVPDAERALDELASLLARRIDVESPAPRGPGRWPDRPVLRAFVPIWRRPWMTINGDTYGSSLLARAGVANAFADHPDRYPTVELTDAAATAPDVVLVPTEPYRFTDPHLAELRAGLGAPVVVVDGRDVFWWGVRTRHALERLRAVVAGAARA